MSRPRVTCLMIGSIDGRLHPTRYSRSPDGTAKDWSALFERVHDTLDGDAWMVGRVTMAEMSKAEAHPPADAGAVERPVHVATRADAHAVTLDPSGKLHFDGGSVGGGSVGGDHVVVVLGPDVPDRRLAELAGDGVSYIVADDPIDIAAVLDILGRDFGIRHLLLEGGAGVNGSLFAAGVVDAFHVLLVPALDGRAGAQGIIAHDGVADAVRLSLVSAETIDHGVVHLHYAVEPAG